MTSQRQQPAAGRERRIPLRPRAIVKPLIRLDKVDAAVAQRFDAFCRSIDERLFVDIEARVNEDRKARLALERAEDIVVEGVVRPLDNLRPCRMVNVYNRRDTSAPVRMHVARYRHIAAARRLTFVTSKLFRVDFQPDLQEIVRFALGRICKYPRARVRTPYVGYRWRQSRPLSGGSSAVDGTVGEAPDTGRAANLGVSSGREISPNTRPSR